MSDPPLKQEHRSSPGQGPPFLVVWSVIAALVLIRLVAPLIPGMWLWGVNILAYLPGWAWILWGTTALCLTPPVAQALLPIFNRLGGLAGRPYFGWLLLALPIVLLLYSFPDHVRFVGDFLMRQGTAQLGIEPARVFPQALPIDVWLHYLMPLWATRLYQMDPNFTNRLLGLVNVAMLVWVSLHLARRLGVKGAQLLAVTSVLVFGSWLLLFTGFAKAFAELTWILVGVAVLGLDILRGRRSYLWVVLLVLFAIWLHRSALGLLPVLLLLGLYVWKGDITRAVPSGQSAKKPRGKKQPLQRPVARVPSRGAARVGVIIGLALVVGSIAYLSPRFIDSYQSLDAAHFSLSSGPAAHSFLSLLSPLRLLDDLNLLLWLVPLAPLALFLIIDWRAQIVSKQEKWFLLALTLPYLGLLFLLRPAQGPFRDFDTFAMSGVVVAIWVALLVAQLARRAPKQAWIAVAIIVSSIVPIVQGLILSSDMERGLDRVEAWVVGPPQRDDAARGLTLDYLGIRYFRDEQWQKSTSYFERAVEFAPSPRIVMEWANAAEMAQDWESADRAFALLLERADESNAPFRLAAYMGLAKRALRMGDMEALRANVEGARKLAPNNPWVNRLVEGLRQADAAAQSEQTPEP